VVVRRDVGLREGLGAALPSETGGALDEAYLAAFVQGVPTADGLSHLAADLKAVLGPTGTASRLAEVDRLVAFAPDVAPAAIPAKPPTP
jgi:hypothetical protein